MMQHQIRIRCTTFIVATGGTVTTCGDFKIHFYISRTFSSCLKQQLQQDNTVDYLVVAGGGGGGGGASWWWWRRWF